MIVRNEQQMKSVRDAAQVAATVLDRMCELVAPGMNTYDLDQAGRRFIEELGAESACYKYQVGSRIFPAYTCLSVNNEVVHGIGAIDRVLQEGDIISVDVCTRYNDYIGDNCRTVPVGRVDAETQRLLDVTESSLYEGIKAARKGNRVGKISNAVQKIVEQAGFSVIRDFVGHGVGRSLHEEPQIPNFGKPSSGPKLREGAVVCIEPMVNMGGYRVTMGEDGWTALSADGSRSAHFEQTVIIGSDGPEILSVPLDKDEPALA
ncbi:MAG: type I methionyl aminopeptidase [Opitutales bacterium TMED158]|nr:MAG: type I methionyl aminopeptidase [Opitutales bacterium TMED158]